MYFSISIALLTLWYGIGFIYMTRKRGLDPSLVTYISPLGFKNFWIGRILLGAVIVCSFLNTPFAILFATLLAAFSLSHIFLLAIFERSATQPIVYYAVFALSAGAILYSLPMVALLFFAIQELYLPQWRKTQTKRYNRWIARHSIRIHKSHKHLSKSMPAQEWFFVLHFAVTENIARPKVVRIAEHAYFYLKKPAVISTGIMQIAAPYPMHDTESMQRGAEIVRKAVHALPKNITEPADQLKWLAREYNGSTTYSKYLFATYPGLRIAWGKIEPTL